jgi:hypothetical protein
MPLTLLPWGGHMANEPAGAFPGLLAERPAEADSQRVCHLIYCFKKSWLMCCHRATYDNMAA